MSKPIKRKLPIAKYWGRMTGIAVLGAIISLGWVIRLRLKDADHIKNWELVAGWAFAALWAIGPIFWFRQESLQLLNFKKYGLTPFQVEQVKVNHESAKAFWFWIGALILTILTSR